MQFIYINALSYGAFPGIDCPGLCGPDELKAIAGGFIRETSLLSVELNGEPVRHPDGSVVNGFRQRNVSPVFSGWAVPGHIFHPFFPDWVGPYGPAAAVGFGGVMTPLTPGMHTIRIYGEVGDPPFFVADSTLNLTVTP
jgi:hypothetical protein